jgi:hypothetical protein
MRVAAERDALGLVDTVKDANGRRRSLRVGGSWDEKGTGEYTQGDVEEE